VQWSGGLCFLFTALFYEILDVRQKLGSSFPLLVLGMNAVAAYEAFEKPLVAALLRHFTRAPFQILGRRSRPLCSESALWR
jgi:hypothetical protein